MWYIKDTWNYVIEEIESNLFQMLDIQDRYEHFLNAHSIYILS